MEFCKMKGSGFVGQLVKARLVKSLYYDYQEDRTTEEYYEHQKMGFIHEKHEYIDDYFLVRFFDGTKAWIWKNDLFSRKEEISLDKYR